MKNKLAQVEPFIVGWLLALFISAPIILIAILKL